MTRQVPAERHPHTTTPTACRRDDRATAHETGRVPLIDNAVYRGGLRVATPATLEETFETREAHGGFAWIGLYRPTDAELNALASEFGLHPLAIEDARKGHQRAKLERYGDTLFVVLRPARYLDDLEQVEFGELHVFIGPDFGITIRHAESPDLKKVRRRLEASPDLLAKGPEAVLYAVLDEVVDEYSPVDVGLENDIDEIEEQLFSGDPEVTRRIYDLASEVMEFQRATRPLVGMFDALERGFDKYGVDLELQRYLRDVKDHVIRIVERGDTFRQLLQNALQVHSTLVAQRQNEETRVLSETALAQSEQSKKVSSWAAIIFAPTLIAGIYGMNFTFMPELDQPWGYPFALALMVAFGLGLYGIFKRRGWL